MTSADRLVDAIYKDKTLTDDNALADYGLKVDNTNRDFTLAWAVYESLVRECGVTAKQLHQWKRAGTTSQEIMTRFDELPESRRGEIEAYGWLVAHPNFVDETPVVDAPAADPEKSGPMKYLRAA